MAQGLPARETMLQRERADRIYRTAYRLAEAIERLGFSPDLAASAWRLVAMTEEGLERIIAFDETLAGAFADLRTPPSAAERRRRITARDTDGKRQRRAELTGVAK